MHNHLKFLIAASGVCFAIPMAVSLFVMGSANVARAQLDEIIVTAERRESNLQDVPVAVTALGGDEIERTGIHDPYTLQFKVPNFAFSSFSAGQSIFSLRGISSNDDGAGTDNSVAVFLDDVYFGRISNSAFDFFDVERVEVLRGPQGTLWGKNAIGGTINIVSKKPSMDGLEVKGKMEIGDYNLQNYGGYVTGPLSSTLAAKFAFNVRDRAGFIRNVLDTSHSNNRENLLDDNSSSWRAQFLWEPSDSTSLLLTLASQTTDENDMGRMPIPNQDPANARTMSRRAFFEAAGGDEEELLSANTFTGFSESESDVYSLKLVQAIGEGELTFIAATYETDTHWEMDSVGAPIPTPGTICSPDPCMVTRLVNGVPTRVRSDSAPIGGGYAVDDDIRDSTEATSWELRYATAFGDDMDVIVGAFYLEEDTDRTEYFRFIIDADDRTLGTNARGNRPELINDFVDRYRQINATESQALFANIDWRFMPDWTLTAGVRWTEDDKDITSYATNGSLPHFPFIINSDLGNVEAATGGISTSGSWDDVSPKVALNWQAQEDMLLYVSWAKGFKSGGFGAAPSNAQDARNLALDPEEAVNIEVGLKADLLDNTLRVNVAAFQTDYEDLQYQRFGPLLALRTSATDGTALGSFSGIGQHGVRTAPATFGFFRTINAGDAEIEGLEIEVTYAPTPNLVVTGAYGYLDTEQEIDFRAYFATDPGMPIVLTRELNRAPENQYSLGFVYTHDMGMAGQMVLGADYTYSDEQRADVVDEFAKEDERELIDASLTWIPADTNWRFTLWGKNIADERYFAHVYTVGDGVIGRLGEPRILGASVSWELQ